MQPQEPITNNLDSLANPTVPNHVPDSSSKLPVLAMAIFVLLSLGSVAFLYYQNQQLKTMLASYQAPVVSATPTGTTDPTTDWKTYINTTYGYSIKHPQDYEEREDFDRPANSKTTNLGLFNPNIGSVYITETKNLGFGHTPKNYTNIKNFVSGFFNIKNGFIEPEHIAYDIFSDIRYRISKFEEILVDGKPGVRFIAHVVEDQGASSELDVDMAFIELPSKKVLVIYGELGNFTLKADIVNQILSTFKFLEATPSTSPTPTLKPSPTPLSY